MKYKVVKTIVLGFMTQSGQIDMLFDRDQVIELDKDTIYIINSHGKRHPSITTENAIEVWLENGQIEEYHGEFVVGQKRSHPEKDFHQG